MSTAGKSVADTSQSASYVPVREVDSTGVPVVTGLGGAVNRSGTAATSSGQLAPANPARRGLNIQNIGANNIGVNEFGGTAAIGSPGTYTVAPGGSVSIRTTNQINAIAATAPTAYTATEF